MDTSDQIIAHIAQNGKAKPKQLVISLGISRRTITHNLASLVASGKLIKTGIVYTLSQGQSVAAQPTQQVAQTTQRAAPTPQVVIITPPQPVKTAKAAKPAPDPIETLGQELLPNWAQKFNIDPAVVTTRYESVRGFIPGLSPRTRNAKKRLLASLYSGIVLVLCFLSVWATNTASKPMRWIKIAGLILIAGLIYVVVFHHGYHSRLWRDQNPTYGSTRYEGELIKLQEQLSISQDETARLKDQLADNQSQLSQLKEQLASHQTDLSQTKEQLQNELDKTKGQLSTSQSELDRTKEQLTQAQQERVSLEQQLKASTQETENLQQRITELDNQNKSLQEQLAKARAELSSVIANEVKQSHKEQIASSSRLGGTPRNDTRIETISPVGIGQIIDWTTQGVPSDEIIHRIKTSHSTYSLQAEDISYLKEHGVSDGVIETMRSMR
ncbi:MAG: hypothetical protein HY209_02480 [Candidatus Omnitrophica bacterium]|nr:hypothetical protein [Candidatus Omnitrophota bacterium]